MKKLPNKLSSLEKISHRTISAQNSKKIGLSLSFTEDLFNTIIVIN